MNRVIFRNVALQRQIRVRGPDAERFVDRVITRDAAKLTPLHGRQAILCNRTGGIVNDAVLLALTTDESWFSSSDSDLLFWLQGLNAGLGYDVDIAESDAAALRGHGP